jgi:hypothetical protein
MKAPTCRPTCLQRPTSSSTKFLGTTSMTTMGPNWTAASTITESSRNTGDKSPASCRSCTMFHSAGFFVPQCRIGERFLSCVTAVLRTARLRHCNSEKVVVFISVILQKQPRVSRARDIKRRLANRLEHWEKGSYRNLVNGIIRTAQGRTRSQIPPTEENFARAYNAKVLSGRICQAGRYVTNRDGGGVLGPTDRCTKTGRPVIDILRVKHPPLREPSDIEAAGHLRTLHRAAGPPPNRSDLGHNREGGGPTVRRCGYQWRRRGRHAELAPALWQGVKCPAG